MDQHLHKDSSVHTKQCLHHNGISEMHGARTPSGTCFLNKGRGEKEATNANSSLIKDVDPCYLTVLICPVAQKSIQGAQPLDMIRAHGHLHSSPPTTTQSIYKENKEMKFLPQHVN